MTLSIIKTYSSDNIDVLNEKLWRDIYYDGNELLFGDEKEPKHARETFTVAQLYGKALDRLYRGDVPKGWLFRGAANRAYINTLKCADKGDQPYTYGQRLQLYPVWNGEFEKPLADEVAYIDQFERARELLRKDIETGIQSNRNCGILWNPLDTFLKSPPCFQWYQVKKSNENNVSLRTLFRSHAYDNACFANWGAIIKAFVDEVIEPAGGVLEELICVSTSAEIEYSNFDMIEAVVGNIPEHIRRLLK